MMRNCLITAMIVLVINFGSMHYSYAELTSKEILQSADGSRGNLEGIKWRVCINSIENDRQQERSLNVQARGYDFLGSFISPPKVKGQKLLMLDHSMWFVKPGLRKSVPVSPRQKLVGGASYGDIAATNYANDYEATPLDDETVDYELCYVFNLKAIHKNATYNFIKYWISKNRLVGVKAEFFTVSGKMFKMAMFEYENVVKLRNEPRSFISKMVITDALINSNVTTLNFSEPVFVKVPDSTFNLNLLMMR